MTATELQRQVEEITANYDELYDEKRAIQHELDAHVAAFQRIKFILADLDFAQALGHEDRVEDAINGIFSLVETHTDAWTSTAN